MSVSIERLDPARWTTVCHECEGRGLIMFQGTPEVCSHPGAKIVNGRHVVPSDPGIALLAAIFDKGPVAA